MPFSFEQFEQALDRRAELLEQLDVEGTDCLRLFHGEGEGEPGLSVDRFGEELIVTAREELPEELVWKMMERMDTQTGVLRVRSGGSWRFGARGAGTCREFGVRLLVPDLEREVEPGHYMDFRVARRWLREHVRSRSVLNLFSYTASAGVVARVFGAPEVWNVDHSRKAQDVAKANAHLNEISDGWVQVVENVIPVVRQLGGLPVKGRGGRRPYKRLSAQTFGVVILDPPTWSKSPFGAVDIVRDYGSLLKPAVLATEAGGQLIVTNHSADVDEEDWVRGMGRTIEKAGRELRECEALVPDKDFPARDGKNPLKIRVLGV